MSIDVLIVDLEECCEFLKDLELPLNRIFKQYYRVMPIADYDVYVTYSMKVLEKEDKYWGWRGKWKGILVDENRINRIVMRMCNRCVMG